MAGTPLRVKQHLIERLHDREITQDDLEALKMSCRPPVGGKLKMWIDGNPEVPEGPWWKEFGSFKLAGAGRHPKTFLTKDQPAFGVSL